MKRPVFRTTMDTNILPALTVTDNQMEDRYITLNILLQKVRHRWYENQFLEAHTIYVGFKFDFLHF